MQALSTLIIDRFEAILPFVSGRTARWLPSKKAGYPKAVRPGTNILKNRERWNDSPGCRGRASPQGDDFQDAGEPI